MFFETYAKQLYIALAIALLFLFGVYVGYSHEKRAYDAFLSEIDREKQIVELHNAQVLKDQTEITTNVTKEYANAVSKINTYYANHPHIISVCNTSSSNAVSSESQSPTGTTAAVEGTTEIDASIASKEIAQCQALIEWEKQQEEVK